MRIKSGSLSVYVLSNSEKTISGSGYFPRNYEIVEPYLIIFTSKNYDRSLQNVSICERSALSYCAIKLVCIMGHSTIELVEFTRLIRTPAINAIQHLM